MLQFEVSLFDLLCSLAGTGQTAAFYPDANSQPPPA
jgi:hypothetical protein